MPDKYISVQSPRGVIDGCAGGMHDAAVLTQFCVALHAGVHVKAVELGVQVYVLSTHFPTGGGLHDPPVEDAVHPYVHIWDNSVSQYGRQKEYPEQLLAKHPS